MYRLTESFPYLLNRVGVRMGELFTRRLEPYDVTLPMYRVMAALKEKSPQSLGDLSQSTSIEISTLSRLIGAMKRKGLLSRTRPDDNLRTVEIRLLQKGMALADELIPLAMHYEEVAVRTLGAEETKLLKSQLALVYDNLDELDRELSVTVSSADRKTGTKARTQRRSGSKEAA